MIKRIREKVQNVAYRRRNSAADGSESGSCVSFHVSLVIDALENCTFKGYTFVKYKHRASGNSGSSRLISVADNKAKWGYSAQFNCRIPISEFTAVLNSSWLSFSVFRERPDGYIKIGSCKLNLSEYTHTRSKVVPSQTVRMLLENCEINSILEVRIALKQTGGSPFFKVDSSIHSNAGEFHEDSDEEIDTSVAAKQLLSQIDQQSTDLGKLELSVEKPITLDIATHRSPSSLYNRKSPSALHMDLLSSVDIMGRMENVILKHRVDTIDHVDALSNDSVLATNGTKSACTVSTISTSKPSQFSLLDKIINDSLKGSG